MADDRRACDSAARGDRRAADNLGPLGNGEDLEEPRLRTAIGLRGRGGAGEDLERTAEIENLDVRKDQDADVSRLRGLKPCQMVLSPLASMLALDFGSVGEFLRHVGLQLTPGSLTSS